MFIFDRNKDQTYVDHREGLMRVGPAGRDGEIDSLVIAELDGDYDIGDELPVYDPNDAPFVAIVFEDPRSIDVYIEALQKIKASLESQNQQEPDDEP